MRNLLEGILSALAYQDGFDFPMTAQEIFLALPAAARTRLEDVEGCLLALRREGLVSFAHGFYALPSRASIADTRKGRYDLAEKKYRRVRRFVALARYAPYLRAVFVCNTLARSNARAESDIDLFLVAAPGRAWITRMLVTGLAAFLRLRPTAADAADRVCLSFFVTSDALCLRGLAIQDDAYLAHWLQELCPVYDESGIAPRLFSENAWARAGQPGALFQTPSPRRALPPLFGAAKHALEAALDRSFGQRLEQWAKRLQMAWMPAALRAAAGTPATDVVLTDTVLKFHDHDRRAEIRDAYFNKREKLCSLLEGSFPNLAGSQVPANATPSDTHAHALSSLA